MYPHTYHFSTYTSGGSVITSSKSQKEVTAEIQAIIRQITASVTFLPLLSEACVFDLLVYADKDATVPVTWEDSDPLFIANAEQVRLRSFNTLVRMRPGHRSIFYLLFFAVSFSLANSLSFLLLFFSDFFFYYSLRRFIRSTSRYHIK